MAARETTCWPMSAAGTRRLGPTPHANGGVLLRALVMPDLRDYAVPVTAPRARNSDPTRMLGAPGPLSLVAADLRPYPVRGLAS